MSVARNAEASVAQRLREALAALTGLEAYARRIQAEMEAAPVAVDEPNPALRALATIESYARSARAEIQPDEPEEGPRA